MKSTGIKLPSSLSSPVNLLNAEKPVIPTVPKSNVLIKCFRSMILVRLKFAGRFCNCARLGGGFEGGDRFNMYETLPLRGVGGVFYTCNKLSDKVTPL